MYDVMLLTTSRRSPLTPVPAKYCERLNGMGLGPSGSLASRMGMRKSPGVPSDSLLNSAPLRVRSMSWVIHWPHWKAQSVNCAALATLALWAWIVLLTVRALGRLGELVEV